jgi:hypothetical protein
MRALIPIAIVSALLLALQQGRAQAPGAPKTDSPEQVAASTYEHLATAIIEIEKTEDELVKSILIGYHTAAQNHLRAAIRDAQGRSANLESAAAEIADIANEGNKPIQAVRQRLAKAGHTHNTDVETKDDYMFINSREKKDLLALAGRVGRAGADAKASDLEGMATSLADLFSKAIAPE